MKRGVIILLSLAFLPLTVSAFADRHDDLCFSNPDPTLCGFQSKPFSAVTIYFDQVMPGFGTLIIWAPVVLSIWFITRSPGLTGIGGIIIVTTLTDINTTAVSMGLVLVAISAGIGVLQIFQRVRQTV